MRYSAGADLDGLQQIVDALADRLGRSVAVDDVKWRLVTASRHFGDEDPLRVYAVMRRTSDPRLVDYFQRLGIAAWTTPRRIPANPDLDLKPRVCFPVHPHGILLAFLFLIDDAVQDWEIELAAAAADEIGLLMYRRLILREKKEEQQAQLARDLVSAEESVRTRAVERLRDDGLIDDFEPVLAVVVDVPDGSRSRDWSETSLREAVEKATRDRAGGRVLTTARGTRASLLFFGDAATRASGRTAVTQIFDSLTSKGGYQPVAGLGTPRTGPDAAARSHSEAQSCAEAAALVPSLGPVVEPDSLGAYAVFLRLPRHELTTELYPRALCRLIEHDSSELLETLESYLDCAGDATRTAGELRIHRSTLYYRLGRIESLAAVDLRDGQQRLVLHMGVKLRRMIEADHWDRPCAGPRPAPHRSESS